MKKALLEFLDNNWALFWFAFGIIFFVFATVSAFKEETEKSIGYLGISLACHARCEVKILQRKIEKGEE